jgi:bacterial/archaeal transporter family protein
MSFQGALKARWFWYSLACALCWAGWTLLSKLGSREIPAETMQFLFTIGTLPVCMFFLVARRFRFEKSAKGISYAVLMGVLAGVGGLTLFAAYHTGGNTSLITAVTALYPMVTVVLALTVLREKLRKVQIVGLVFACVAIVIFSM